MASAFPSLVWHCLQISALAGTVHDCWCLLGLPLHTYLQHAATVLLSRFLQFQLFCSVYMVCLMLWLKTEVFHKPRGVPLSLSLYPSPSQNFMRHMSWRICLSLLICKWKNGRSNLLTFLELSVPTSRVCTGSGSPIHVALLSPGCFVLL